MTRSDHPAAPPSRLETEANRMTQLAGRAAQLLRVLRTLRRARDDGTISAEQYEAAVDAIDPAPDRPLDL